MSTTKKSLRDLVAAPAPAIIGYIKQRDFKRLDAIVADWESNAKLSNLQAALGISIRKNRGRPRTQRAVAEESEIVNAVVGAAMNGADPPFAVAARQMKTTARKARDAWDTWAKHRLESMRVMAKYYEARGFTDAARVNRIAIDILQKRGQ
jgi:hypothetical protein